MPNYPALTEAELYRDTKQSIAIMKKTIFQKRQAFTQGIKKRQVNFINWIAEELDSVISDPTADDLSSYYRPHITSVSEFAIFSRIRDCDQATRVAAHFESLGWDISLGTAGPDEPNYDSDFKFDGHAYIDLKLHPRSYLEASGHIPIWIYMKLIGLEQGTCAIKYREVEVTTTTTERRPFLDCD